MWKKCGKIVEMFHSLRDLQSVPCRVRGQGRSGRPCRSLRCPPHTNAAGEGTSAEKQCFLQKKEQKRLEDHKRLRNALKSIEIQRKRKVKRGMSRTCTTRRWNLGFEVDEFVTGPVSEPNPQHMNSIWTASWNLRDTVRYGTFCRTLKAIFHHKSLTLNIVISLEMLKTRVELWHEPATSSTWSTRAVSFAHTSQVPTWSCT